ncbi:hypothetical protein EYF80_003013 [Liparis tanakae]|uniref:Uncharacterized protein n=1 Tax=Liparis tanakae TaxID=230148 RepID=A0A4Z2J9P9_9TELE|nr:hypothetical protein EYF80_003013 [Liparis tanakae]
MFNMQMRHLEQPDGSAFASAPLRHKTTCHTPPWRPHREEESGCEGEMEGVMGMSQCREEGQGGRRAGTDPEARVATRRWIGRARRSQKAGEPGDEVFSLSHLL